MIWNVSLWVCWVYFELTLLALWRQLLQRFLDLKHQHNQSASVCANYFTQGLEKWSQQNGKLHYKMTHGFLWTSQMIPVTVELGISYQRSLQPHHFLFILLILSDPVLPCLVFSPCVDIEITSVLSEVLNDDQTVKKNRSWRHIGQFNYINLIRRNFQSIITVKYYVSPLPQTFISLNLRILMPNRKLGQFGYISKVTEVIITYFINIHLGRSPRIYQLVYNPNVFVFFTKDIILAMKCMTHRGAIKSWKLHLKCATQADFPSINLHT